MSSPTTLDPGVATWLSTLDPALALLPTALPTSSEDTLHDLRWTPGEGCRLSYRHRTPGTPTTFVAVDVTGSGWQRSDYREDPRLPGLSAAADPSVVEALLAPVLDDRPTACRVEPVRFRSGSRCVLRYDVATASAETVLYAKVFRPDRFPGSAALGHDLAGSSTAAALVPRITATWPELHVVVGAAIGGRPVSAVLGERGIPGAERARLARRLGGLLAGLHRVTDVSAPPWTAADQVESIAGAMAAAERADPAVATLLHTCLDELAATLPAPGRQVLSHGSFRAAQVVCTEQGDLVALDTDRVSRSDPARDLGAALAHLTWQGIRQPRRRRSLNDVGRALLEGYRREGHDVDPQSLLWWRAAGLLQVAVRRYRRLEVASWPKVPLLAAAVEELLAADRTGSSPSDRGESTDVLDCEQMSRVMRHALAPAPVRVRAARQVTAAAGRRCVIGYTVDGLDGSTATRVIGKAFIDPARARLLHEHLCLLAEGPFRDGRLRVPTPLALLTSQRMVLYRRGDGWPLDRIRDHAPATAGARDAARWLARLHGSRIPLPRRFSLARERETTRQWSALVGSAHAVAAEPARTLAARWWSAAREAAADVVEAPIHKDFHAGHVLTGPEVCVLDLDEARLGDPALDLAHFCTYLEAVRGSAAGGPMASAFMDEYVAATGWSDPGSYASYCAHTWLKVAKQITVGSGPFRGVPAEERQRLVVTAVTRGLACLDA